MIRTPNHLATPIKPSQTQKHATRRARRNQNEPLQCSRHHDRQRNPNALKHRRTHLHGYRLRGFTGNLLVIQDTGTVSGTTPTLDGKIQNSADGSTGWADISGATFAQVTASNNTQTIAVAANACLGYIRYVGTIAGTTPSFMVGVQALGTKTSV